MNLFMRDSKKSIKGVYVVRHIICLAFIIVLCVAGAYFRQVSTQGAERKGNVLFLSGFSPKYFGCAEKIDGIAEGLYDIGAEFDVEYMDSLRYDRKDNIDSFRERLNFKLRNLAKYNAIVASDDESLSFIIDNQKEMFDKIPVFFYGVSSTDRVMRSNRNPFVKGVADEYSLVQNIRLAETLNPDIRRIVLLADDTIGGFSKRERFESLRAEYAKIKFEVVDSSSYTFDELQSLIESFDAKDTSVIFEGMCHDRNGKYYDAFEQIQFLKEFCHAPVFSSNPELVGEVAVGGYAISYYEAGKIMSQAIGEVLDGVAIGNVKLVNNVPYYYLFDYEKMREFGYTMAALPSDTVYMNSYSKDPIKNKYVIYGLVVAQAILFIGIIVFIVWFRRRQKIHIELKKSRDSLIESESRLQVQYDRMEYIATHDYLTGLLNRQTFMDKMAAELISKDNAAFIIIDVDDFKEINDTIGHHYGDELLKQIADRIVRLSPKDSTASRFGGDEFIVCVNRLDTEEKLNEYIDKFQYMMHQKFVVNGKNTYLNFSLGVTMYPRDGSVINDLVANADLALATAKTSGKDICSIFHESMKIEAKKKKEIEESLRRALVNDEFEAYYQPKVACDSHKVIGFEALIRIKGSETGPSEFIPIAEETGLIMPIDRWITKEVISQLSEWKKMGLANVPVSVNYSVKQLRDNGFVDYVASLLSTYDVEPELLDFEITEGILLEEGEETKTFLDTMHDMGISFSLDDFGTGYSSLNYLNYLEVDTVKLDKSMIDRYLMHDDEVIACTIALVHSLKMKIVAEGIDNYDDYKRIKECGCDYIQGNIFGKPMNKSDATAIHDKTLDVPRNI